MEEKEFKLENGAPLDPDLLEHMEEVKGESHVRIYTEIYELITKARNLAEAEGIGFTAFFFSGIPVKDATAVALTSLTQNSKELVMPEVDFINSIIPLMFGSYTAKAKADRMDQEFGKVAGVMAMLDETPQFRNAKTFEQAIKSEDTSCEN